MSPWEPDKQATTFSIRFIADKAPLRAFLDWGSSGYVIDEDWDKEMVGISQQYTSPSQPADAIYGNEIP